MKKSDSVSGFLVFLTELFKMYVLDFVLNTKVKSLFNIICDLNEKTNLLIWHVVFPVK